MTSFKTLIASLAVCSLALLNPTALLAGSSAASSAAEGSSASVGSVSKSIGASSDSSKTKNAAAGDYKITDVAFVSERPGMARMALQALAAEADKEPVFLYLPQATAEASRLVQGDIVTARERPYGMEFANGQTKKAFFLVVHDDWYQDLQTTPVTL